MAKTISPTIKLKNRRILVTGSSGFLGREVIRQLETKCPNVFGCSHKEYDLRESSHVRELLQNTNPDCIIHCAATVGGIGDIKARPGQMFYDNMQMGINLMEQARQFGILKLVNVGSSCLYPAHLNPPFKETEMWEGYPEETVAPYALAKKMLLVMSQAYRKQYGFNSIYLIPTNLYGPGDNFDLETSHVVAALIRKFTEGKDVVEVWGTGTPSREFLHVEDCARAIVLATEKYDSPEPVNIGTGEETPMKILVEMIRGYTKFKGVVVWNSARPDGKPRCGLDVKLAYKAFGFKSKIHLEYGLLNTIKWYKENCARS
jgi:GDP-L-fucose synthase